jgi:hypothetical protein
VGTYAILFLLGLLTLVVLVYLPKVRKPALWITISIVGLGGVGLGGVWFYQRHRDREYERTRNQELSLLVDHAIGKPPDCKAKPFTVRYDAFSEVHGKYFVPALERAKKRAMNKLPPNDLAPERSRVPKDFVPDPPPAFDPNKPSEGVPPEPFDPEIALCAQEVVELATFIKDHDDELNDFISRNQNDPRVAAVQTALDANGIEFHKTCKDLEEEKLDAYELHKAGCK